MMGSKDTQVKIASWEIYGSTRIIRYSYGKINKTTLVGMTWHRVFDHTRLDTALGCPATDLSISLFRLDGLSRHHICTMRTNADGRTDGPILPQADIAVGFMNWCLQLVIICGHAAMMLTVCF